MPLVPLMSPNPWTTTAISMGPQKRACTQPTATAGSAAQCLSPRPSRPHLAPLVVRAPCAAAREGLCRKHLRIEWPTLSARVAGIGRIHHNRDARALAVQVRPEDRLLHRKAWPTGRRASLGIHGPDRTAEQIHSAIGDSEPGRAAVETAAGTGPPLSYLSPRCGDSESLAHPLPQCET
jgi:hypothetical protein